MFVLDDRWDFVGNTIVTNNYVRLTSDRQSQKGAIWNTVVCHQLFGFYYLHQGGYVIIVVSVCLSVCLLATLHKNVRTDLHESFRERWQWGQ